MFGGTTYVSGKVNTNLQVKISLDKSTYKVGEKGKITTIVTGGIEPYTYRLIIHRPDTNDWWSPSKTYQNEPFTTVAMTSASANKELYIDVVDRHGEYCRSAAAVYTVVS